MLNRPLLRVAVFAASLVLSPPAVLAQQFVVSGGAVSLSPLFQSEIASFPAPAFLPYVGAAANKGQTAFLTNTPATPNGHGSVHLIASESPLARAQIDDYLKTGLGRIGNGTGHGPLIQIPIAGFPVVISFRGPTGEVSLNKTQLCRVFSGAYVKWSELGVDAGSAPDRFTVIYHAEDSGITQILTHHLQASCGFDSAIAFEGKSTFAQEFPSDWFPPHFTPAVGSDGAAAAVSASASAITYMGPDPAFTAGLGQALLVNPNNNQAYAPSLESVLTALDGTASLPVATGVVQRDPDGIAWIDSNNQANPFNWVRPSPNPTSGYPIVGYASFVFSQCHVDSAVGNAIKDFLNSHFSARNSAADWGDMVVRPIMTEKRAQELIAFIQNNPTSPLVNAYKAQLTAFYDDKANSGEMGQLHLHKLMPLTPAKRMRLLSAFVYGTTANLDINNTTVCGNYAGRN